MSLATKIIFIAALVLSIIIPFGYYLIGEKNKKRYKRTIGVNAFFFFGAFAIASIMCLQVRQMYRLLKLPHLPVLQSQQEWDILQPHLLQVFPVSAVVSLLQVQPAQHLEQSARIPAFLVNP